MKTKEEVDNTESIFFYSISMIRNLLKALVFIYFLLGFSLSAERIQIFEDTHSLQLTNGTSYHISENWIDVQNPLDLEKLYFQESNGKVFSLGYSPKTVITKIPLHFQDSSHKKFFLTIDFPSLDRIEFLLVDPVQMKIIQKRVTGDKLPFSEREFPSEVFTFSIQSSPQWKDLDIYLVTQTTGSHKLPLIFETPEKFQERIANKYLIWGLFLGLIFAFFSINLIFWIFARDTQILFYILYTFSLLWLFLSGLGLGYRYIFPNFPFIQNNLFIFISSLSTIFKILFYIHFLNTKKLFPGFFLYFLILISLFIGATISYFLTEITGFYSIVLLLGPVSILSLATLSIKTLKNNPNAIYFLIAECFLFIGVLVSFLSMNGIIPHSEFNYQIFLLTVGIEILVLSIALGKMIYTIKLKQESAESASIAKGIFLSTMSHEIRTPLSGVLGFLELLEDTELNETQRDYLYNAQVSGRSLLDLINDILDFSKIEAGKLELKLRLTSLSKLVSESLKTIQPQAYRKGLLLETNIENVPEYLELDSQRIKQVLLNLLGNAVKFTEQGKVILEIQFQPITDKEGIFQFKIIDTGIGIKPSDIGELFQVFTQADSGSTRRYEGTGLGLAISDSLIRKMGGKILVDSIWGKGSTFSFSIQTSYWKVSPELETPLFIQTPIGLHLPKVETILIAEDDKMNLFISKRLVEGLMPGIRILEAKNGLEVLEILKIRDVQMILMDIQMPEMDGLEATKLIRENQSDLIRNITIIGLSANAFSDEIDYAKSIGMNDYITKPIDKNLLKKVLDKYCY